MQILDFFFFKDSIILHI